MARRRSYHLVIDLEATCDRDGALPRSEMEVIEIGAVLCDRATLQKVAEYQTFVRPVRHLTLTAFCTELTSITQAMVDAAPRFPEAFAELLEFIPTDAKRIVFGSWGDFDREQFERDCKHHRVRYALPRHLNLKLRFAKKQRLRRSVGMKQALKLTALPLLGTHHRGIDDARNIALLLPWIVGSARIDTPTGDAT